MAPSGPVTPVALSPAGSAIRSPTAYCVAKLATPPLCSSSDQSSGTNFDDTASWLSSGCQPLAST